MALISVIMPIYNGEKHLEAAINSALSQGIDDIEIIAVDDCSEDDSRRVLQELAKADSRIRPIYSDTRLGVAGIRSLALEAASGEYIAFLDCDDTLPKGAYYALLKIIADRDVAIGGYNIVFNASTFSYKATRREKKKLFMALNFFGSLCNKLFRRSFILDRGLSFDSEMTIGEDGVFLAKLAVTGPSYAVTDKLVYNYHKRMASEHRSLVHTYTPEAFKLHILTRKRIIEICEEGSIDGVREYVFKHLTEYIDRFVLLTPTVEKRAAVFECYKAYIKYLHIEGEGTLFSTVMGFSPDIFYTMSAEEFFEERIKTPARDRVLMEYENGQIGFGYIIKYLKKWIQFKLGR